ncbi:MAG: hypothetical protein ACD_50C00095G0006 [uncultured bacterium]|nr:MAG: hypothetical protein ACD_50C00095G0006 [uncultured bacterium]
MMVRFLKSLTCDSRSLLNSSSVFDSSSKNEYPRDLPKLLILSSGIMPGSNAIESFSAPKLALTDATPFCLPRTVFIKTAQEAQCIP